MVREIIGPCIYVNKVLDMMRLKILSYNIHKGFDTFNAQFVLRQIKQSIDAVGADLVFLQEVVGLNSHHKNNVESWPDQPQFEFLADKVWSHYSYGQNAIYDEGHHGNAILSKYPIVFSQNTNISNNRFEQRGFLHARIQIPEKVGMMSLVCLHFDLFEGGRRKQVDKLTEYIHTQIPADEPLIVAGDFNDWTGNITKRLEVKAGLIEGYKNMHGHYAKTFPAKWPLLSLDRVLGRHVNFVNAHRMHDSAFRALSDHLPLLVDIEVPKAL